MTDLSRANAALAAPRWSADPEPVPVSALTGDHRISQDLAQFDRDLAELAYDHAIYRARLAALAEELSR